MPSSDRDPFAALESYLAEKALGAELMVDFLSTRVFLSDPAGTTDEERDDA